MKRDKRALSGVLLLDKPTGISSNAALTRAKILFQAEKAGHTGTLDPFASGLLPVCFGEATKFAGFMLDADKRYLATIRLGRTTTTGDPEGETVREVPVTAGIDEVTAALQAFTGPLMQCPPIYSALKVGGKPLYRLAREGVEIPRALRAITIRELKLLAYQPPFVDISVSCSKGTYIRVLGEDIGNALGCGGMLTALRRTGTGSFALRDALTLVELSELPAAERDARLGTADSLVAHLPRLDLAADSGRALQYGRIAVSTDRIAPGMYRAYAGGEEFLGLIEATADGMLRAQRMMSPRAA